MKPRLRRFAEWAISLRNKLRDDPFFQTGFNIISLQVLSAASILVLVALAFNYLYTDIVDTLLRGIIQSIGTVGDGENSSILTTVQTVKAEYFAVIFGSVLAVTVILAYFVGRVALKPAKNAMESQKRFISDVAHELRTPLSVIKTNCEVALMDASLDKDTRQTLQSNIEELDRASEIINNLLTLSNLIKPNRMDFSAVDLGIVVDDAIRKLKELAKGKQLEITVKKTGARTVRGNVTALEQIVTNLLKNAINYTPPGGNISITVGPDYRGNSKNIFLTVQDSGVGIAQKDLFHIFEPFYRAERSRNRQTGSSGLGLTIVSELIKLHSGKINIKSAVNSGTTATVLLPGSVEVGEQETNKKTSEISVDFLRKGA